MGLLMVNTQTHQCAQFAADTNHSAGVLGLDGLRCGFHQQMHELRGEVRSLGLTKVITNV